MPLHDERGEQRGAAARTTAVERPRTRALKFATTTDPIGSERASSWVEDGLDVHRSGSFQGRAKLIA